MEKQGGVYRIKNLVNDKIYVGSAINLAQRKSQHFHNLQNGKSHNSHLQNSYDLYGKDNFIFEIIEYTNDNEYMLERENYWIDLLKANNPDFGYNVREDATNNVGIIFSKEHRQKISDSRKGTHPSDETREKISNSSKGRFVSEITRQRMSVSRPGFAHSKETRDQMSVSRKGRVTSKETREKQSVAGKGRITSTKTKEKISLSHIGIPRSDETRSKISLSRMGMTASDETREKFSIINRGSGNNNAKLTEEIVFQIRLMILEECYSLKELSENFDVSVSTISSIKNNKTWKHVEWPTNI
jgi:hypothetical protein